MPFTTMCVRRRVMETGKGDITVENTPVDEKISRTQRETRVRF